MREDVLQAVLRKHIIFVIGAKDTGKTTLVKNLANECFRQGHSVGIIDADVGQSDIGPPTTIGLGTVESSLEQLGDAMLRSFYFVGTTSPKGHLLPMLIGVRQMLDRALSLGLQKIFIDTTGLVSGPLGRILKESKIAIVQPDLILCLQINEECERFLRLYDMFEKPTIVRLKPDPQCRSRTTAARRGFRESALRKWFSRAMPVTCSLNDINFLGTTLFQGQPLSSQKLQELANTIPGINILWGEIRAKELLLVTSAPLQHKHYVQLKQIYSQIAYVRDWAFQKFENMLVGLLNRQGDYCALGILRSIDFSTHQATIVTTASKEDIVGVKLSNYSMRETMKT